MRSRLRIDSTGIGAMLAEEATKRLGAKCQGVQFTVSSKGEMYGLMRRATPMATLTRRGARALLPRGEGGSVLRPRRLRRGARLRRKDYLMEELRKQCMAWLERTNPLRGLSISRVGSIYDMARKFGSPRLQYTCNEIEKTDPVVYVCCDRRESALAGLKWSFVPRAHADEALAKEQADALTRRRSIDYPILFIYIRKALGERDYGRFIERHGIAFHLLWQQKCPCFKHHPHHPLGTVSL